MGGLDGEEGEMSDQHVSPTEVLECLRFVRTHLYAAQAQAVPGDDTIIMRHVYDAYRRVSEVCNQIEIWGVGMAIPAVYHINATSDAAHKMEGPFRLLVAACNRLDAEAEEYQLDDVMMGKGAALVYWHDFDEALERAKEALSVEAESANEVE
jgi:hypothetical protein